MPSSVTPPTEDARRLALLRGLAGLLGAVGLILGVGRLCATFQLGDRLTIWLLRGALLAADLALVYAVWQLGVARDRRWDWRGLAALVVMLVAWPTLLMLVMWTAMAAYVLVTGRPLRLFGE